MLQNLISSFVFRGLRTVESFSQPVFTVGSFLLIGALWGVLEEPSRAGEVNSPGLKPPFGQPQLAAINSAQAGNAISVNGGCASHSLDTGRGPDGDRRLRPD